MGHPYNFQVVAIVTILREIGSVQSFYRDINPNLQVERILFIVSKNLNRNPQGSNNLDTTDMSIIEHSTLTIVIPSYFSSDVEEVTIDRNSQWKPIPVKREVKDDDFQRSTVSQEGSIVSP